jgi:hypothetical protein
MARTRNPWTRLGFNAAVLGMEAAQVMSLRMTKLASGGPAAGAEARRMVSEKVEAASAWQALAMTGALGFTAPQVASRTLTHYRRKVRQNRRRLLRST